MKEQELLALTPHQLAADIIETFRDNPQHIIAAPEGSSTRYAVHRAAEVRAWELAKQFGGKETTLGRHLGMTAGCIADRFHDVQWKEDTTHNVPVLA